MTEDFKRRDVVAIVATIAVTALICMSAGVAARRVAATDPVAAGQSEATSVDPQDAVGTWWIDGDASLDGRLVAMMPNRELTIYGDDGCEIYGSWTLAESGLANFGVDSWLTQCSRLAQEGLQAVDAVAAMQLSGGQLQLTTLGGEVVATLRRADDSSAWPQAAKDDADLKAGLEEPYQPPRGVAPKLPQGMSPPSIELLVSGRWVPLRTADPAHDWPDQPFAEFSESGRWTGSDGCNGQGGRWALDAQSGEWLASSGMQTLIGCNNVDVSKMVTSARLIAVDGEDLVFLDESGDETGRFVLAD